VNALGWTALAALLSWVWLLVLRGFFWRTDIRLPAADRDDWPAVAIIVPARNESEMLPQTLPTLLAQDYPGPYRVILVDDNSTDGTGEIAADMPVTVERPAEPPPGWAGKLWALNHGVAQSGDAELLLFTDADIAHRPESLRRLVAAAGDRDLVSQMARLRTRTGWEKLIVPAFVYFFAMLYPFRWSNAKTGRTAAAAGGCTLVRRTALEKAGGVAAIRGAVIDDVALAGLVKRNGGRIWLGLGDFCQSIRPYPGLASLWQMIARSAYAQLRHSVLLLVGTVAALALVFLVPPAATIAGAAIGDPTTAGIAAAAWILMAATYLPMVRYYRRPWPTALLLPFTAALYAGMTVDSAVQHWRGRGAQWKGRTYQTRLRGG
jgi:hopene-associated glycosyltransferase HpnB